MFIKMLETRRVCDDGYIVRHLYAGDTYELSHSTGTMIVRNGWGHEVEVDVVPPVEPSAYASLVENLFRANMDFDRIFRPQPTRGCAPTNPATLAARGDAV